MPRLAVLLALATCACSSAPDGGSADPAFPTTPYAELATDGGNYRVEVRTSPEQPPQRGELQLELRIADAAGAPVAPASLVVVPWMPAMGHGTSTVPDVVPTGVGVYRLDHVELFMPGTWQLRVSLAGDQVVVPIAVE